MQVSALFLFFLQVLLSSSLINILFFNSQFIFVKQYLSIAFFSFFKNSLIQSFSYTFFFQYSLSLSLSLSSLLFLTLSFKSQERTLTILMPFYSYKFLCQLKSKNELKCKMYCKICQRVCIGSLVEKQMAVKRGEVRGLHRILGWSIDFSEVCGEPSGMYQAFDRFMSRPLLKDGKKIAGSAQNPIKV